MGDSSALRVSNPRLDSWKEIAGFFGRDERTVRRWEKERGLPVHRVPGVGRSMVFAYTDELKEWLKGREAELLAGDAEALPAGSPESGITAVDRSPAMPTAAAEVLKQEPLQTSTVPGIRVAAWLAPLAVLAVLIAFSLGHRESRYRSALAAPHAPNAEAQELYLKGEYHWSKRTPGDLNQAVDYFTQSIVKDPGYAQAYVGLADCYNLLREFSVMPPEEAYPRALAAAQKAVELDDTSAGAHNSLAFSTFYWKWDPVTAEREYKRALQLDPNFVQGHHWYATFLLTSGRIPESLKEIEQARTLDPSSTTIQADKGLILFYDGRKDEAFTLLKQLELTDPSLATTHAYLAVLYQDRKDYANFFEESKRAAELRHDPEGLAAADAAEQGFATGGVVGMREGMLRVQKQFSDQGSGPAYDVAVNYALLGKEEDALQYLHTAYDKRETGVLGMSRDPALRVLQDNSEYQQIAARVEERFTENPRK